MEEKKEYILCSAIWFDDGIEHTHECANIKSGFVVCGRRHHNVFSTMYHLTNKDTSYLKLEKSQGFLTNTNRFVDRYEGRQIAFTSGQTKDDKGQLFSEDLW